MFVVRLEHNNTFKVAASTCVCLTAGKHCIAFQTNQLTHHTVAETKNAEIAPSVDTKNKNRQQ